MLERKSDTAETIKKLEREIVAKRLGTLLLSIGTIVAYGYALGGVGGYLFGKGRPFVAAAGLIIGSIAAICAMKLWKNCLAVMAKADGMAEK